MYLTFRFQTSSKSVSLFNLTQKKKGCLREKWYILLLLERFDQFKVQGSWQGFHHLGLLPFWQHLISKIRHKIKVRRFLQKFKTRTFPLISFFSFLSSFFSLFKAAHPHLHHYSLLFLPSVHNPPILLRLFLPVSPPLLFMNSDFLACLETNYTTLEVSQNGR
jgi:hypothetical protein